LSLSTYPNSTITYEQAIGVNNTAGSSRYIRLRHVSVSPNGTSDVGNFRHVKFYLIDSSNVTKATLNYTTSGNYWSATSTTDWNEIPLTTTWYIKVETLSPASPTSGKSCTITIAIDVQQ